ncbi:pre-mRNA-splicing factor 38B [Sarocladium implicatum]|nr:pre-mRNA-splicing factor 38B [Sarocladium implicatum]
MANDELLTDDFVAGLLANEANDCSLKYSALGMDAFRSNKKPENKPKPNTRFLRHIIKSTDSHNKALLAKEAAESKARLGDLDNAVEDKKQEAISETKSMRRKQMGDIQAILGGKKRSAKRDEDLERRHRRDGEQSSSRSDSRRKERSSRTRQDLFDDKGEERRYHGRLSRDDEGRDEKRSDRRRRREEHSDDERRHRHRSHRHRSRSPRRVSDSREKTRSRRHRSPARNRRSPSTRGSKQEDKRDESEQDADSDPLEDLIGPAPAPKYRGRGTVAGSSGIDRRFSESYDPKADVDMDEQVGGESNWDDAVEAFRDRQRLRQSQQERLRAAGFGDDQIQKMSGEGDPAAAEDSNVRWTRPGEKREWDLGKEKGKEGTLFKEFSDEEL